jgi:short-subunit dehydrogenase
MRADLEPAHALVTGAAGAIGSAIATRIAESAPHARLTLVDKRPIAHAFGDRARTLAWDLSAPDALEAAWQTATRDAPVDWLVNCAGFMEMRTFAGTPWDLGHALLDVDLVSPLRLMSLAVPSMRARASGVIVNVASLAGLVPLRGASYYGAAKAGLAMASEIARLELRREGVRVLTVYPGPVASELERRARSQLPKTFATRAIPIGEPRALAKALFEALERGAPRVVFPPVFGAVTEITSIARRFTERFSPSPNA